VLVASDNGLSELERTPARFTGYVASLEDFLESVADRFDVCIIDTNPNPDIRLIAALVLANYVVSPVQMNQESIDGLGRLLNHPRYGVNVIRARLNPGLRFVGLLPNLLDVSRFQRSNLAQVVAQMKHLFIAIDDTRPAFIPYRSSVAEAQSLGLPLWELGRTRSAARDTWRSEVRPTLEAIARHMEVSYAT
jgi:chromosome partitioning protein